MDLLAGFTGELVEPALEGQPLFGGLRQRQTQPDGQAVGLFDLALQNVIALGDVGTSSGDSGSVITGRAASSFEACDAPRQISDGAGDAEQVVRKGGEAALHRPEAGFKLVHLLFQVVNIGPERAQMSENWIFGFVGHVIKIS